MIEEVPFSTASAVIESFKDGLCPLKALSKLISPPPSHDQLF